MTTTNERILFIIKHFCEGNKAEFARIMEEKPQTINGWLKRNNGNGVLNKILAKFPMVSPSWLLAGEGEMLKATEEKSDALLNAGAVIGNRFALMPDVGVASAIKTGAVCAATSASISGFFGSIFSSLFGENEDITEEEAVEVLKDALEDAKKTTKENEELKQEIEYWRQKANNLEYELSKSQTKVG